ncbi:hypothetical protein CONLIGDRAFT_278366 [Coniochaeta ligniaria NRRL 30616]|uniref:Uncharacterized protein n=1 Tax=Coniochaeta ligniaria NRRL 30616 TaxID=1408157 RepID=A0A1J7I4A9_9PEZI|nr:hypothetical protein CONLIGDRAFT_278366 [Coniochaeta ligniaria NRRL 30616]
MQTRVICTLWMVPLARSRLAMLARPAKALAPGQTAPRLQATGICARKLSEMGIASWISHKVDPRVKRELGQDRRAMPLL